MKKIFSLITCLTALFALLLPLNAQGQSEKVKHKQTVFKFEKSLEQATIMARELDVPLMLVFINKKESDSRHFEKEILNSKDWKRAIAGKVTGYCFDASNKSSKNSKAQQYAKTYNIDKYPAYLLIAPRSNNVIFQGKYSGDDIATYTGFIEKAYEAIRTENEEIRKEDLPFRFEESMAKARAQAKKHNVPIMLYFASPKTSPEKVKQLDAIFASNDWVHSVNGMLVGFRCEVGKSKEYQELVDEYDYPEDWGFQVRFIRPDGTKMFYGVYSSGDESIEYYLHLADSAYRRVRHLPDLKISDDPPQTTQTNEQ